MAESPEIQSAPLLIVPFSEKHLSYRYVSWLNDSEFMRFSEQRHNTHSLESCRAYWQSFYGTSNYFWAISVLSDDLGHIGNINAYVDERHKIADIGILIGESKARGKGYATKAFKAICDFLLRKLELRKVTAGTISPNEAMLSVMRKAGMVEDGVRKRHYVWAGGAVDVIHMAMFRDKWRRSSLNDKLRR